MIHLLRALRPHQWTKNLLVLAGPLFALRLFEPDSALATAITFVAFCMASSSVYLFNDLRDRARDRQHPTKRFRPIAAGNVAPATAAAASVLLAAGALGIVAARLPRAVLLIVGGYLVLQIAYTLALKHVPIVDALVVATGFVLRAVVGAVAIRVEISQWFLITTIFFALFVSLAKRRNEVSLLREHAREHRDSLERYDVGFLDQLVAVATAATLISYALYTTDPATTGRLDTPLLPLTIPIVVYALFRFLWLTHRDREIGDPARALIRDPGLLLATALWGVAVLLILYFR